MPDTYPSPPIKFFSQGSGPTALLIHGFGTSHDDWSTLAPALASIGYQAIAIDLPGHGDSAKPHAPGYYHAGSMYNTLVSWIDSCPSIKPLLLIGHSMGGYFCLRYAWQHPEHVSGLGLINPLYTPGQISPVLRLLNCSPRLSGRIIGLAPSWLVMSVLRLDPTRNKRLPKPHLERFIHDYKQLSPHVFTLPHTLLDLKSSLQDIPCPALVVWGKRDLILNPASFPLLVQQLPQAVSLMLPTVGHEPHLEYPALVNPHMVEFSRQFIGRKNPILR